MSETDPYKHIRALAQSITDMQMQIIEEGPATPGPIRHHRRSESEICAMADALRAARTRKGLTQRELGRLAGVPQSHISKIEAGGVDLRLSSLLALAHVLDLTLSLAPAAAPAPCQSNADRAHESDPVVRLRSPAIAGIRHDQATEDLVATAGTGVQ